MQVHLRVTGIYGKKVKIEIFDGSKLLAEQNIKKDSSIPGARQFNNARPGQTFTGKIDEDHNIIEVGSPA